MSPRARDVFALCLAIACAVLGGVARYNNWVDPGVSLVVVDGDHLEAVGASPLAAQGGSSVTGGVVIQLNGEDLLSWGPNGDGFYTGAAWPFEPPPADQLAMLATGPIYNLTVIPDVVFQAIRTRGMVTNDDLVGTGLGTIPEPFQESGTAWEVGLLLLVAGAWFMASGRAGSALQPIAVPLMTATAAPLLLLPAYLTFSPQIVMAVGALLAFAFLPLGLAFLEMVSSIQLRRGLMVAVAVAFWGAVVAGWVVSITNLWPDVPTFSRAGLVAAIAFVPGFAAADPSVPAATAAGSSSSGRLIARNELLVAALTPVVALTAILFIGYIPAILPLLVWLLVVLIAGRFSFRPLARLATRAQLHRDLVVAAMEAERSRLATNIHDDALQDVTLLVRRLDAAGDLEGAELARSVAERLRAISGDLRLPILDDLGAGPALDWLVNRVERLAGGDVRLERGDETRPPPDVELVVFRIAQEALANAVKHGRPPIVVRYRAMPGAVSLTVDDTGPGIDPKAAESAPGAGHYGLLTMGQRAEQIGAILDVRRWPAGGTHVSLEWRPR